jgi:hypothetical protein
MTTTRKKRASDGDGLRKGEKPAEVCGLCMCVSLAIPEHDVIAASQERREREREIKHGVVHETQIRSRLV